MDNKSIITTSKRYLGQYSDSTLIEKFTLTGFETKLFLYEITSSSISFTSFNNMFIPFILPRLVVVDLYSTRKHVIP